MIHPIRAWNAFFFTPTSARPMGAIRIGFGLLAMANLAVSAVDLTYWYTDAGLLRGELEATAALVFAETLPGGVEPSTDDSRSYAEWLGQWPERPAPATS